MTYSGAVAMVHKKDGLQLHKFPDGKCHLKRPGKRRTAPKLVKEICKIHHDKYVEPMVGAGSIFRLKRKVCPRRDFASDIDCRVPRRPLKGDSVTCGRDFRDVMRQHDSPSTLFYLDPPYDGKPCLYRHCDVSLEELKKAALGAKGTVLISYSPERRRELCGGPIKCKTIKGGNFFGRYEITDILAIKRAGERDGPRA